MPDSHDGGLTKRFAASMTALGGFEPHPRLAVGVSGGGDSMALVMLAAEWARRHGGQITALSVDHGLRDGSADEARQVGQWMRARGIAHGTLVWADGKPLRVNQAAARDARYQLLETWCMQASVRHLLIGHTLEDQAETFLMRAERGSGPDGLAAMSAVRELAGCRVLRPLLSAGREELRQFLRHAGQPWIDDPSNTDETFRRTGIRKAINEQGLDVKGLAEAARRYGEARVVLEQEAERLLACSCRLHGAGFAEFSLQNLLGAPEDTAVRAVAQVVGAVGGSSYLPRRARVEALLHRLRTGETSALTFGRCEMRFNAESLSIFREDRNLESREFPEPSGQLLWDGRFRVSRSPGSHKPIDARLCKIQALGQAGWCQVRQEMAPGTVTSVPHRARLTLPAVFDEDGVFSVPLLNYKRPGIEIGRFDDLETTFRPRLGLSGSRFFVAQPA